MKLQKLVLALVTLASSAAFACPDLNGAYTCVYNGQSQTMSITQSVRDGITYYNLNDEELAADNQARPIPDDESLKSSTLRGWCEGNVLKAEILGKVYNQGELFGDLALQVSFLRDADRNLEQVTTGAIKSVDQTYPLDEKTTCMRDR